MIAGHYFCVIMIDILRGRDRSRARAPGGADHAGTLACIIRSSLKFFRQKRAPLRHIKRGAINKGLVIVTGERSVREIRQGLFFNISERVSHIRVDILESVD
jgi:hypothetical protein